MIWNVAFVILVRFDLLKDFLFHKLFWTFFSKLTISQLQFVCTLFVPLEEKLSHHRQQGKRRLATAKQELDYAQTELMLVEKDRRDGLARVEVAEADVRSIEAKIEEERLTVEREIEEMIDVYKKFESAIIEKEMALMTAALTI